MNFRSSRKRDGAPSTAVALSIQEINQDIPDSDKLELKNAEFAAALSIIVSAFVDLGFGTSAAHHALGATNRNQSLKALTEKFQRDFT